MSIKEPTNRRQRQDRRIQDIGPPPGLAEQRVAPERRHPEVEHVDFDEHIELVAIVESTNERRSLSARLDNATQ